MLLCTIHFSEYTDDSFSVNSKGLDYKLKAAGLMTAFYL